MLTIGTASTVITPELGAHIQGGSVNQRAESVRDELEANALYLSDGTTAVLLVSCDIAALDTPWAIRAREAMAAAAGLQPRDIIIGCTHTHAGPSVLKTNYFKPVDTAYLERLHGWLVELAAAAVASAQPGQLGWGVGTAQVGWNRRCCWADGTHTMYGDTKRADFTGLEGPDDPQHLALFARDATGKLLAVLHHNTSHPVAFYGANFFSADFPGDARKRLREVLGEIPVLFFNGAQGDQCNLDLLSPKPHGETADQCVARGGATVAGTTLRLLHQARFTDSPVLAHVYTDLPVPVRLPTPQRLAEATALLARVDAGETAPPPQIMTAHGVTMLQRTYGDVPTDTLALHAVRLGDVLLATEPCELYCQYALTLKRRSPAPHTAVVGLADGFGGYCPTLAGILGGGYSGEPIYWTRLVPEAGDLIVDGLAKLAYQAWRK